MSIRNKIYLCISQILSFICQALLLAFNIPRVLLSAGQGLLPWVRTWFPRLYRLRPATSRFGSTATSSCLCAFPSTRLIPLNLNPPARRPCLSPPRSSSPVSGFSVGMLGDTAPSIDVGAVDDLTTFVHHRDDNHRLPIVMLGTDSPWL